MNEMGAWLKLNGEAIYDTRPWKIFGEGPTKVSDGHHSEAENKEHVAADVRFTTKGDILYAISLGWPKDGVFTVKSLARDNQYESQAVKSVRFVSGSGEIKWKQTQKGPVIRTHGGKPSEAAYTFRIKFK